MSAFGVALERAPREQAAVGGALEIEPSANELNSVVVAERSGVELKVSVDAMGPVLTKLMVLVEPGLVDRESLIAPAFLHRLSNRAFSFPCAAATWGVSCSRGQSSKAWPVFPQTVHGLSRCDATPLDAMALIPLCNASNGLSSDESCG